MIEIPDDLLLSQDLTCSSSSTSISSTSNQKRMSNWFILPRPEGKRCLVVASKGKTISYLESGQILHYFNSVLPGGGLSSKHGSSVILDCIYSPSNRTYYLIDLMNWNEMSLYECDTEFRFYWLHTKYFETSGLATSPIQQSYSFQLTPYWECSYQNILEAYNCEVNYIKNGLLFYHREAQYETSLTPCVLLWKDNHVTRYLNPQGSEEKNQSNTKIGTEIEENVSHLVVTEQNNNDVCTQGTVTIPIALGLSQPFNPLNPPTDIYFSTLDGYPLLSLPLSTLPEIFSSQSMNEVETTSTPEISSKILLRGYVTEVGYMSETDHPYISGFIFEKVSPLINSYLLIFQLFIKFEYFLSILFQ